MKDKDFKIDNICPPDSVKGGFKKCRVYETVYDPMTGLKEKKREVYSVKYNLKGFLNEKIEYTFLETWSCDSEGSIVSQGEERLDVKTSYEYDEKGNVIEKFGHWHRVIFKYDKNDNVIEEVNYKWDDFKKSWYESDCSIKYKLTYLYDENGNVIEKISYGSDGSKASFKFDESGNLIEYEHYRKYENDISMISIEYKLTYKYDEDGNVIENFGDQRTYSKRGKVISIEENQCERTYKYDEKGNMIEKVVYGRGWNGTKKSFKYDENGNVIEVVVGYNGKYSNKPRFRLEYIYLL